MKCKIARDMYRVKPGIDMWKIGLELVYGFGIRTSEVGLSLSSSGDTIPGTRNCTVSGPRSLKQVSHVRDPEISAGHRGLEINTQSWDQMRVRFKETVNPRV